MEVETLGLFTVMSEKRISCINSGHIVISVKWTQDQLHLKILDVTKKLAKEKGGKEVSYKNNSRYEAAVDSEPDFCYPYCSGTLN